MIQRSGGRSRSLSAVFRLQLGLALVRADRRARFDALPHLRLQSRLRRITLTGIVEYDPFIFATAARREPRPHLQDRGCTASASRDSAFSTRRAWFPGANRKLRNGCMAVLPEVIRAGCLHRPIIAAINRGIEHRRASGNVAVSPKLAAQQVDSPSGSVRGITRAAGSMPDERSGNSAPSATPSCFCCFLQRNISQDQ